MITMVQKEDRILLLDDDKMIGEITFETEDDYLVVDHTFVDPTYRGQNLARQLVDAVVEYARSIEKKILPTCSYVVKVFERTEAFHDVWEKDLHGRDVACKI